MKIFTSLINSYPFYQKCRNLWAETQINQIIKGLQKYNEPLTPKHHTPKQLVTHALEEAVDLTHYIVALGEQNEEQAKTISQQVVTINALEEKIRFLENMVFTDIPAVPMKPSYMDLDD